MFYDGLSTENKIYFILLFASATFFFSNGCHAIVATEMDKCHITRKQTLNSQFVLNESEKK